MTWFSDPEDDEVLSSPSEHEEVEDTDFSATTEHLTQDFLCQVIQEEEGQSRKTVDDDVCVQEEGPEEEAGPEEEVGPQHQVAPLAVILGNLPSAASLSLQETFQTFDKAEAGGSPDGDNEHFYISTPPL